MELVKAIYAVSLGFEPMSGAAYWVATFLATGITFAGVAAIMPALLTLRDLIKGA